MADVVTPSGQRLHVVEEGRGAPLLLIHGWAMSSEALQPLAERLAGRFRTLRYDLRGHGRSGAAPSATLEDHCADLAGLLEALALEEVLVVAWSLGAQVLLRSLPATRARLRGAVLIGATPRFTLCEGWSHGLPGRQVEVLAQRFRRAPSRTRERFLADMQAPSERERLGDDGLAALDASMPLPDTDAALAGLEILATADLRAELSTVDLPLLLLHGAVDPICLPGASSALAEAVPGARRIALPDAGHAPFLARPDEVAAAILDFAGRGS
jgi:pimeloyl-ACP methyl ester esterase